MNGKEMDSRSRSIVKFQTSLQILRMTSKTRLADQTLINRKRDVNKRVPILKWLVMILVESLRFIDQAAVSLKRKKRGERMKKSERGTARNRKKEEG